MARRPPHGQGGAPAAPPSLVLAAAAQAVRRRLADEWRGLGAGRRRPNRTRSLKLIATPRDFRPTDPEHGKAIIAGRIPLAGAELEVGPGGDPWDRPSPTRRFAVELHRFAFLPDLAACGAPGAREGLRLFLDWRRAFGRPDAFAWGPDVLERRVFNLACAARRLSAVASDVEAAELFGALLHQADYLLSEGSPPSRAAERAAAAALAAAAFNGPQAERLLAQSLKRLTHDLHLTVLPDGGHRTRSPAAGLELLLDLLALDDLLLQRGREAPLAMVSALDRLSAATRFHTLADGRLSSFHGGEASAPERVQATMNEEQGHNAPPPDRAPHSGFQRLEGPSLQVMVDTGPPAQGPWSLTACGQPLALEILAGSDRIFANGGWSPDAAGPQAMRLSAAANTLAIGRSSAGWPLTGFLARALGPRLIYGAQAVEARREENEAGVWLEMAHDGWLKRFGLTHQRRLFVARNADELRGEDVLTVPQGGRPRAATFTLHFHLFPGVKASVARDGRSVLLRGPSDRGWWFRNDAAHVSLEMSVCFIDGQPRRTQQVALQADIPLDGAARVRWKLTPVEAPPPKSKAAKAEDPLADPTPEMLA